MSAPESTSEATLFDLRSRNDEPPPPAPGIAALDLDAKPTSPHASDDDSSAQELGSHSSEDAGDEQSSEPEELTPFQDRKRIEEQLDALKRKEIELRRALVVTDHPELAEPIRTLGSRAFAVSRAESKLAQGLSKGEIKRREGIEKKLGSLRAKRDELAGQISELEGELGGLGSERLATFEAERRQAMEQLLIALGQHEDTLRAAGLEASVLVPEIGPWMPELEKIAKALVADRA